MIKLSIKEEKLTFFQSKYTRTLKKSTNVRPEKIELTFFTTLGHRK